MSRHLIDVGGGRPLLDMPHAAYPEECRPHHYAEFGRRASWSRPLCRLPRCREPLVIRHSFEVLQRVKEPHQSVSGPKSSQGYSEERGSSVERANLRSPTADNSQRTHGLGAVGERATPENINYAEWANDGVRGNKGFP